MAHNKTSFRNSQPRVRTGPASEGGSGVLSGCGRRHEPAAYSPTLPHRGDTYRAAPIGAATSCIRAERSTQNPALPVSSEQQWEEPPEQKLQRIVARPPTRLSLLTQAENGDGCGVSSPDPPD